MRKFQNKQKKDLCCYQSDLMYHLSLCKQLLYCKCKVSPQLQVYLFIFNVARANYYMQLHWSVSLEKYMFLPHP